MALELEEGRNKPFQKHDLEGAMFKYEKALKLLPSGHSDLFEIALVSPSWHHDNDYDL